MAIIVEAVNLRKTYLLGKVPLKVLRGVNLKVEEGDFLAVLGPSGSVKFTLLNMIGALDKPTEGMKNQTVLMIFLSEAIIIGLMGSAIGIASGWD